MQKSVKRSRDAQGWRRCSESFGDFFKNDIPSNAKANKFGKKERNSTENHKDKEIFAPGNIFEKLAFPSEETSQSIAWSSSDNEEKKKVIEPVKKRKKFSPRSPTRQTRSSVRQQKSSAKDETIEICSSSDTEKEEKESQDTNATSTFSVKRLDAARYTFGRVMQTEAASSTFRSSEGISIKGYESDPDVKDICTGNKTPPHTQEPDSQSTVSISTESPINSQSGLKASDWVKSLQLKTPSKKDQSTVLCDVEDSARKKKKHSRGGLADQLTRLQNRDKSSVRVWKHQHTSVSTSQDGRSVSLEVIGFESLYSLQLLRCQTMKSDTESQSDISSVCGETRLVMIPFSQAEQLKLQPGMMFKVYPPWQQLELSTGQQIMLCTKYCHVLEQTDGINDKVDLDCDQTEKITVKAMWNCPCAQGLCRNQNMCPAYQFPCIPGYIQDLDGDSTKTQEKDDNSNTLKAAIDPTQQSRSSMNTISSPSKITLIPASSKPVTTYLHTIGLKSNSSRKNAQSSDGNGSKVYDSILESIESDRWKGVNHSSCLCFKGHVHKKTKLFDETGNVIRNHLFVEDVVGTVCVLKLSNASIQGLGIEESCLEGKTFQFTGLKVDKRVTRTRNPYLLSMVDRLWSGTGNTRMISQDTEEEMQDAIKTEEPAGFCYILEESEVTIVEMVPCLVDLYPERELKFYAMSDMIKSNDKCVRCDCMVRVVYIQYDDKDKQKIKTSYVIDGSRTIPVCVKYQQLQKDVSPALKENDDNCRLIKDLCAISGELAIDEYTSLATTADFKSLDEYKEAIHNLQQLNITAELVSDRSKVSDLVTVTGVICEVDEESAYSWEVCRTCGSDQLQIDSTTGVSNCNGCKETTEDVDVRMKMEVIIKVGDSNILVKCDLLQATIESLLPKDEEDEDGYELSSVLNKHLGPLQCCIIEQGQRWAFFLKEIQLLN